MLGIVMYYLVTRLIMHSDGSYASAMLGVARVGGFITLLEYGFIRDRERVLLTFLIAGTIMCAMHYATYLMYQHVPGGMRGADPSIYTESIDKSMWFFFKHDNGSAFFFLPVMTGFWYYYFTYKRGLPAVVVFSAATLFMYWSLWTVTAMIALTVGVIAFIYIYMGGGGPLQSLTFKLALIIGIAFCLFVIFISTGDIADWLGEVFEKSEGLSGRGRIWERSINCIKESPWFGSGYENDMTTALRIGKNHCHNIVLQIPYTGGIITTVLLLIGHLLCDLPKETRRMKKTKGQLCLLVSIVVFFVMAANDWYLYVPMPMLLFILYHYSGYPASSELESDAEDI